MQNNFYFLRKVTRHLREHITGYKLAECYSQNKNELIIGLADPASGEEFYIRAMLRPDFCCLSFPETLHRAKRNSVDLFSDILDLKVQEIVMYQNERAFRLDLEKDFSLLFKMHGNRSNILLFKNNEAFDLFNSRLPNDLRIDLNALDRPLDHSYQAFLSSNGKYEELFPTFGKEIKNYLKQQDYPSLSIEEQWKVIQNVLDQLNNDLFYIYTSSELPVFSLIDFVDTASVFNDPIKAVSSFYVHWLGAKKYQTERSAAIKKLTAEIKKDEAYINTTTKKLHKLESESNYRQWADLLMANLHNVRQGEKEAVVEDFYNEDRLVRISLNTQLSPQKNAERYYQKAKNQHKEIAIHKEGVKKREESLLEKLELLQRIEAVDDIKELQNILPEKAKASAEKGKSLPYHYFNIEGYDVLVGKSARHNDILLQQHSKKDDLWLHARNAAGSHVIIRAIGNEKIPSTVIEKAAGLAAWNSKRKSDSLCPVIFTQRKYVRKRKGDPPGAVVVDREEVLMVEPSVDV